RHSLHAGRDLLQQAQPFPADAELVNGQDCSANANPSRISRYSSARRDLSAYGRFGLDLELALSGGGNYHDRAKARSKPTQEPRENVAVPFQSIGSRGSPVSTLIIRPMTS